MKPLRLLLVLGTVLVAHAHSLEVSLNPGENRTVVVASFEAHPPTPQILQGSATVLPQHAFKLRDVYLHLLTLKAWDRSTTLRFQSSPPSRMPLAADWAALYQTLPGLEIPETQPLQHGPYLIITTEGLVSTLAPLVRWLRYRGFPVQMATLEEIGTTTTEIKAFIQNAYDTWRPEYVLLVGDVDMIGMPGLPTFTYGLDASDLAYALLDGDDYLPDVFLGRIPVDQALQLQVVVAKTLDYEQVGHPENTDWLERALMVASTHYAITTKLTKLTIRDRLLEHGYLQVDTVFWYSNGPQPGAQEIRALLNNGVGIVNYRGWSGALGWSEPPFHIPDLQQLNNGWQLPVLFNITCGAGNFASSVDPCFGEAWLQQGTPTTPRGGVAFVGPTNPSVHTRWNNAIDAGIFQGMLSENLSALASLTLRGLLQLMQDFPDRTAPGDSVEFYFHVYHTLGEPALQVRTQVPESLQVSIAHMPDCAGGWILVEVQPLPDPPSLASRPWVAVLTLNDSLVVAGSVDETGRFEAQVPHLGTDSLRVVVTAPNALPWQQTLPLGHGPLEFVSFTYADGNNGIPEPDEQGTLQIVVRSTTPSGWSGVYHASLADTGAVLLQDTAWVSSAAGQPDTARFPILFHPRLADGYTLRLRHGPQGCGHFSRIQVQAPALVITAAWSPEGPYLPHGNSLMHLWITNRGHQALENALLHLTPATQGVGVSGNPVGPISLGPGQADTLTGWQVFVPSYAARGRLVWFRLDTPNDAVYFAVPVGPVDSTAPTGPDAYGYWVYDDLDTETGQAPTYEWLELETQGTPYLLGDDSTVVVPLPFGFRFYGQEYHRISICSNGWIALDSTLLFHFRNWPMPSFHGPALPLIAPLWDDLEGRVYTLYDAPHHRFVVEWVGVNRASQDTERFEVFLYDPAYVSTPTGDGEILMQYHTVTIPSGGHYGATVGIENADHTVGLQYTYGPFRPPTAAALAPGRALRWTPIPPDTLHTGLGEAGSLPALWIRMHPARNAWVLQYQAPFARPALLEIYRSDGRRMLRQRLHLQAGMHQISLAPQGPAGIYFLRLYWGKQRITRRFLWVPSF